MSKKIETSSKIGFISLPSISGVFDPLSICESNLKVATVFYEKLFLHFTAMHLINYFGGGFGLDLEKLFKVWDPIGRLFPDLDPQYGEKSNWLPHPDIFLDNKGEPKWGLKTAVDQWLSQKWRLSIKKIRKLKIENPSQYSSGIYACLSLNLGSVQAWLHVLQKEPCVYVSFSKIEELIIKEMLGDARINNIKSIINIFEFCIPSVRQLPWSAVLTLREHKKVSSFRNWIFNEGLLSDKSANEHGKIVVDGLWDAISELQLNCSEELIKGIACNLPLGPINPIGIASSVRQIFRTQNFIRRFNWLIFLHEVRDTFYEINSSKNARLYPSFGCGISSYKEFLRIIKE